MQAVLDVSKFYRGQLQFFSDDPYFISNVECPELLTTDGHVINQDQVFEACNRVSNTHTLNLTDAALQRLSELTNEKSPTTISFKKPFEGFEFKRFQKRAINVMENEDNCMLQIDCGCGKSIISTFMACQRFDKGKTDKIVVWCPIALVNDWIQNIESATNLTVSTVPRKASPDKRAIWYENDTSDVWILNYERVRTVDIEAIKKSFKGHKVLFIFDEVQKLANRSSTLSKEMKKLSNSKVVVGNIALTATPIVRGPENFYNEFRVIDPSIFGNVKDFERLFTYNNGEKNIFRAYVGYKNLAQMHLMAGAQVFSATKDRKEIAVEFPQKYEILIPYKLTEEIKKAYDEIYAYGRSIPMEDRCGTLFASTLQKLCTMPGVLLKPHEYKNTEYSRQQKEIDRICQKHAKALSNPKNNAKLSIVMEKVEEIVNSGGKVIVFGEHTHNCLFPLANYLEKYKPLLYTGGMSVEQKEAVKHEFKFGNSQVLLMSDAGKEGLNFQTCRYVIHFQTPIRHAVYRQRSDRVDRLDTEFDSLTIMRLMAENTIETRIEDTMQGRRQLSVEMGFGGSIEEFEEYGTISQQDASYLCGF